MFLRQLITPRKEQDQNLEKPLAQSLENGQIREERILTGDKANC